MLASIRNAIAAHALAEYPREACGVVVAGEYIPCTNTAETPTEAFCIAAEDYAAAEDRGVIEAVVHSHPGARAQPSHADLTACEAACVPLWIIISLGAQPDGSIGIEDWCEFGPTGYEAPLIGCEFSHGTNDCYGLVRRYYRQTHGVILPDFERSGEWWADGRSDLYTQNFGVAGFEALPLTTEPQTGDVLLMKIRSRNNVPNHAAVYIGDGLILHHCWGQLSRRDQLPRYRDYVTHVLRYKESLTWTKSEQLGSTES
jgi:cell wall-associated NlpC family hydrolase